MVTFSLNKIVLSVTTNVKKTAAYQEKHTYYTETETMYKRYLLSTFKYTLSI